MKNMQIIVILIVVAIAVVVVLGFFGIGNFNFFAAAQPQAQSPAEALLTQVQQSGGVSQLEAEDVTVGTGDPIAPGDTITVSYTGVLADGTVFDSTAAHGGTPLTLVVGADGSLHTEDAGSLIAGWSQGMAGMKEGGRRLLAIPPSLGYGPNAYGPIPANSTLIFDLQVLSVSHSGASTAPPVPAQ